MNFRILLIIIMASMLAACAHPLVISPLQTPVRTEASLVPKNAAYVMTDADRAIQVTSPGGGGDEVSYFPYRDLEKAIRDALRAVYSDVYVIKSPTDNDAIKANKISFVFAPQIQTTSRSESIFTWPPTHFSIDLTCKVTDAAGNDITSVKAIGAGDAEFSEFKNDMSLAGKRAATQLSENLRQAISANQQLR